MSFNDTNLVIGLGASRTGTAWLSDYFYGHPEVLMSPVRVLHYFDIKCEPETHQRYADIFRKRLADLKAKLGPDKTSERLEMLEDHARMFTEADGFRELYRKRWSGEKAFADITPSYYLMGSNAFQAMRDAHPNVRVLLTMRNPIDRHWSGLRLALKKDASIDVYGRLEELLASKRVANSAREYDGAIERMDAVFDPATTQFNFFETFLTQPGIDRMCDFIGVSRKDAGVGTKINQTDPLPLSEAQRAGLYAYFKPVYEFCARRFPGEMPDSWVRDVEQFGDRSLVA